MLRGSLRERGVRVPEDIGLVSFDGLPSSGTSVPALTTVRQPVFETGRQAVRMLNDLISGVVDGPLVEILPVELVVRDSCGATRLAAGAELR